MVWQLAAATFARSITSGDHLGGSASGRWMLRADAFLCLEVLRQAKWNLHRLHICRGFPGPTLPRHGVLPGSHPVGMTGEIPVYCVQERR